MGSSLHALLVFLPPESKRTFSGQSFTEFSFKSALSSRNVGLESMRNVGLECRHACAALATPVPGVLATAGDAVRAGVSAPGEAANPLGL